MQEIKGIKIEEDSSVYEPSDDSFLAMKAIDLLANTTKDKKFEILDVGTGTGLLGIYAANRLNAGRLVLVDINEHAVALAKKNSKINRGLLRCEIEIIKSDLFEKVAGTFDLIIFNAPYLRGNYSEKQPIIERAWNGGANGIEVSERFMQEARSRLKENGTIILTASSFGNLKKLEKKIKELGYKIKMILKEHYFFEDIIAI
ncbi:MAG: HemK2/MTQ2 family protein methyltransferase, partial [Candidatus Micrarchaeia archaeon]